MPRVTPISQIPRTLFEPEHEDYRESYRKFLEAEVIPNAEQWESDQIVPRELFTKAAEHGFLSMGVPEQYGGAGVTDWRFNVAMTEEATYSMAGSSTIGFGLHTDVALPYLLESANEEQRERWFPGIASGELILAIAMTEPGTGSDLAGIQTRAVRDGDDYIVNGAKTFITNGINADLVITAVRTGDHPHKGLTMMVIERGMEGFERGRQIEKLGQHASDTAELFFKDVRVPAANVLGEEGSGFMQLVSKLVPERLSLAVGAISGAEVALAVTLDYVKERTAFGKPIGSFQNSRFVLADLHTRVTMMRCFVDRCVERHLNGQCGVDEAAMAKYQASDLLHDVTDAGLQLHGGYGYTTEYPISRMWVDQRIMRIYAGTNEIMKELIGRTMGL